MTTEPKLTARERAIALVTHWRESGFEPHNDGVLMAEDIEATLVKYASQGQEEAARIAGSERMGLVPGSTREDVAYADGYNKAADVIEAQIRARKVE